MIIFELFYTFFIIGLFTFGGGYAMIPLMESQLVGKGWISTLALYDYIAISECTPGPFAINVATFVGSSMGGIIGSIASVIGVILPSFIIILLLATVLRKFSKNKFYLGAINGVKPIIISLISSTVLFLIIKTIFFSSNSLNIDNFNFDRKILAIFLMLLGFNIIYKKVFKKPLNAITLIILSALLGIVAYAL